MRSVSEPLAVALTHDWSETLEARLSRVVRLSVEYGVLTVVPLISTEIASPATNPAGKLIDCFAMAPAELEID